MTTWRVNLTRSEIEVIDMTIPQWRVRLAQQPKEALPTRVRVYIGSSYREFTPEDARQIADRLHDLADRIDELERGAKCPSNE